MADVAAKDYDEIIDRAFANYTRRLATRYDVPRYSDLMPSGDPDRSKSYVHKHKGIATVVICSADGEGLAYYRIHKNGRLRFVKSGSLAHLIGP